ncbi:MAG TPA: mannose-1-phosphate guanylyltransferase [Granulicella sp.]|jgi:mannose-1-phosphate guanylyltransferase|nr:mannose-1-phosphate guanylyltransferase [Granulicella sp.]
MPESTKQFAVPFAPVILAGGSGTRFWPRSRRNRAKQVLALDGEQTMIQQTVGRLLSLTRAEDIWVITNELLDGVIGEQLPEVAREHILSEPAARNTAPACALAAFLLEKSSPETVIGIFPADHVVKNTARFAQVIRAGIALAASGAKIVVLGVPPTRAETGYGYIEQGEVVDAGLKDCEGLRVRRVKRFTEKPEPERAAQFVASGSYVWNSGIFIWSARTLAAAIREHCPAIAPQLERIAAAYGTPEFAAVFAEVYPQCQNISIDYAVLEPRSAKGELASEIYCLPADFEWNDLGSWASLHEHQAALPAFSGRTDANVIDSAQDVVIEARANYVYAPGKMVVLVGVDDLVVVETDDALLITTRSRSQDIGKVVKTLSDAGREELI